MKLGCTCVAFMLIAAAVHAQEAPQPAPSAAVRQAPSLTRDQQLHFLRRARIIDAQQIGKGITRPFRLTLSDGTLTHDAAFQSIEDRSSDRQIRDGQRRAGELRFADSWMYNVAAYRIAGLLGIEDMMPATVERAWNGKRGSLTWWVDNVMMDEEEREDKNVTPPVVRPWYEQRQRMVVFAALLYDVDRNKGNVIYTTDWRVVMIDFTRAFRLERTLRRPDMLDRVDRNLFRKIEQLSRADVEREAGKYLTPGEISAMFDRRDQMVQHFRGLIAERGEGVVFY